MAQQTVSAVVAFCLIVMAGFAQKPAREAVYTSAQADAGRIAYEKTCGRCHTLTLMGRHGDAGERPEFSSLSEADRTFIDDYGGSVPPLAGKEFLQHWGAKTTAQLVTRFQEAKFSFRDAGLTDDEDIVRITAYVLRVNRARAGNQPLTRSTQAIVNSLVK